MGWFDDDDDDDDDDDEEEERRTNKRPKTGGGEEDDDGPDPLDAFMSANDDALARSPTENGDHDGGEDDEGGEDPLDAFMNSSAMKTSGDSRGGGGKGRLDVDNEDEATAHWDNTNSAALSATATAKQKEEIEDEEELAKKHSTGIDPLGRVDHSKIDYLPFRRCFYRQPPQTTSTSTATTSTSTSTATASQTDANGEPAEEVKSFTALAERCTPDSFPSTLLTTLSKSGFSTPTPVQSSAIPSILSGNDVLCTASTGSGKTLAFVLPLVVHCCDQPHVVPGVDGPIGLILSPTRELAQQTHRLSQKLLGALGGRAVCVTGGNLGRYELTKELKRGCEIVCGTPGRIIDLVRTKGIPNLHRVTMVVLDEADKMLDMGFERQVSSILENCRPDRQTIMMSATFKNRVARSAESWLADPVRISVGTAGASSEYVTQHVMVLRSYEAKREWMMSMLPTLSDLGRMIIFVGSRADCEQIAEGMRTSPRIGGGGYQVASIHGDKHQSDRNRALGDFKRGRLSALVATDVAARGLDVRDVATVVNFDVARTIDAHVHRVGRAGRMSAGGGGGGVGGAVQKLGSAYTLLTPKDADFANSLAEAFHREDRPVSAEHLDLAQRSRHFKPGHWGGGRGGVAGPGRTNEDFGGMRQHPPQRDGGSAGRTSGIGTGANKQGRASSKRDWSASFVKESSPPNGGTTSSHGYYGPTTSGR